MARDKKHRDQKRARAKQRREHRKAAQRKAAEVPSPPSPPPARATARPPARAYEPRLPLDPPAPERCFPPVFVEAGGGVVESPYAVLGLPEGETREREVQDAWRRAILAHPPERDPDGARRVQEARARLLDPERVLERAFGALRVPDPAAWGLEVQAEQEATRLLPALDRLVGQAALYALLEEEPKGQAAPVKQAELFRKRGRSGR